MLVAIREDLPARPEFLLYGARGMVGSRLAMLLQQRGILFVASQARLEDGQAVEAELDDVAPLRVLLAAGITGRPNVDWCEAHAEVTYRVNVDGVCRLVEMCSDRGIHVTYYGTGCIYSYDGDHPVGGRPFTEDDAPNFTGSVYSRSKVAAEERMQRCGARVLILRLRMPVTDDDSDRNLITKLSVYSKLIDVPNSVSVLSDLLPVSLDMATNEKVGVYNFTNPGAISHREIMALYRCIVDPSKEAAFYGDEDPVATALMSRRSNCHLDCSKLLAEYPDIPEVRVAVETAMHRLAQRRKGK